MKARRDGLWLFFLLTYAVTWGFGAAYALAPKALVALFGVPSGTNPGFLVAVYAPSYIAIFVALAGRGRAGIADLFSRLFRWRVGLQWYALATLGILALGIAVQGIEYLRAGAPVTSLSPRPISVLFSIGLAGFVSDPGPLGEELGWRGFALPRLEQRMNGLSAALVLGGFWSTWHLPAFFIPGLPQASFPFWAFLLSNVSLSVLMVWVVNNARGSVILAILMHWASNRFQDLHPAAAPYTAAVFVAAALVVVLSVGHNLGARHMPAPP